VTIVLTLAVATFAATVCFGTASAQDKTIELKFAHWVPTSHPIHPSVMEWAADIEKASGGTIKTTIYPAQQLGKAFDHYNMARDGIADIALVQPAYEPGHFPIWGAVELPFLVANAKEGSAAVDAWYRKYAEREMKEVKYCLSFVIDPGTWHTSKKKIVEPGDVAGMKIRPAGATVARWVSLLGGTNVQASAPETREIIEKGVADGLTFNWGSVVLFGVDKVTKYHMEAALYVGEQVFVLNKDTYSRMSAAQKKVIDDHCTTDWALKIATPWADFEHGGIAKIKAEPGHEVYPITPEQLAAWRKSAEPLTAEWEAAASKAGYDPKQVFKDLKTSLDQYKAAY
jgi:TRAP-type C4-dicarboxylate transport system substrate-binding protein